MPAFSLQVRELPKFWVSSDTSTQQLFRNLYVLGFVLALRKQRLFKCFSGSVEGRDKAALTSTCEKMEESTGGVGTPREALCELRVCGSGGVERGQAREKVAEVTPPDWVLKGQR